MAEVGLHAPKASDLKTATPVVNANDDDHEADEEDLVAKLTVSLDIDELLAEAGLSGDVDPKSAKDDEKPTTGSESKQTDSTRQRSSKKSKNKRQRLDQLSTADRKEHDRLEELVLGSNATELFARRADSQPNDADTADVLKPAWNDEEDAADNPIEMSHANKYAKIREANETFLTGEEYSKRLRKPFQQQATDGVVPKWASLSTLAKKIHEDDIASDDMLNVVATAGAEPAIRRSDKILPAYAVKLKRCRLLNRSRISKAAVETVKFHPVTQVALVAGWDRHVSIFQVDEDKQDSLLQDFYFAHFPITDAVFCGSSRQQQSSNEVIVCSKIKPHLHSIDLVSSKISKIPIQSLSSKNSQPLALQNGFRSIVPSSSSDMLALLGGKSGAIHIMHAESKEFVLSLQMNGAVNSCVWHTRASHCLYSIGDEGVVYLWDVRYNSRCIGKGLDQGCLKGSAIDMASSGELVAVGSSTGVVNVYDAVRLERKLMSSLTASIGSAMEELEPVKVVKNLTTPITGVKFNAQSETLAIWSRQAANSMRLLRTADFMPTATDDNRGSRNSAEMGVFHNFPAQTEPLGHVENVDFSPSSGYMAVGNYQGRVNLYRMLHYDQY